MACPLDFRARDDSASIRHLVSPNVQVMLLDDDADGDANVGASLSASEYGRIAEINLPNVLYLAHN